ncbi:MAG: adenylate/guanylate cyclase domain-containing protein, partial [Chloroflexota bacterium]
MPELIKKLAAYVPQPVVRAIYRDPQPITAPQIRRWPTAVLFSDISGFTPLSELLSQAGPTGAEELTYLINQYFTEMILIIERYHGQVVKFSGDALTVLFPADPLLVDSPLSAIDLLELAIRQACECGLAMQDKMTQFVNIETSQGNAALSMKVGIGAGEILEGNIGGVLGRWEYVVGGDPLVQVSMAEHHAKPGQVILSPQAWHVAQPFFIGEPTPDGQGFINLYRVLTPLSLEAPPVLDWDALTAEQRPIVQEALECYVPGAIKARLNEQADWLAELRRMTIVFVGIGGFDYDAEEAGDKLHNLVKAVQELVYQFEGSLGKVAVDDKGTVLLILFGAPPFSHEDDATRAVACALSLQRVAHELQLHVSVGITEGSMFAGPVGAPTQREYTVIGDQVNLAARLMQHGRAGTIIISEKIMERAGPHFIIEDLGQIAVKGKAQMHQAYLVKGERDTQDEFVTRYLLHEDRLIGRKTEVEQVRRVMARTKDGHLQILFIESELGFGKSRLTAEMVREWVMAGGVGYGSKSVSYNQQTPYQAWREILAAIYGLTPSLTPERQLARLATGITDLPDPPDQPNYWANRLPLLADVLGLDASDNEFTVHMLGELRRDNTFALFEA